MLSPRGMVDSGVPVVPQVVVYNSGQVDESLAVVVMFEDGFVDVVEIPFLGAMRSDTVEFRPWTPQVAESTGVWAWTECIPDSYPSDDTLYQRFLVVRFAVSMEMVRPDTLDSGQVFVPQCWVRNGGNVPVSFNLTFNIPGEYSSATSGSLPPGEQQLMDAPDQWIARPGTWVMTDSLTVVSPDTHVFWQEDTMVVRGEIFHDVEAVRVLAPTGTIDTMTMTMPSFEARNNSPVNETCWAWFMVVNPAQETVYNESINTVLQGTESLFFRPSRFRTLGPHQVTCSLFCARDQNPGNDATRGVFEVVAQGLPDIRIVQLNTPPDTIDTIQPVMVMLRLRNQGTVLDTGWSYVFISDPGRDTLVYAESVPFRLNPGQEEGYGFPPRMFRVIGPYSGLCHFWSYGGCADSQEFYFYVRPGMGIAEGRESRAGRAAATLVGGVLFWQERGARNAGRAAELLDIGGKRVAELRPGANDVSGLSPGIYFVRQASGVERDASGVTKVVVTR
jgi:hypothetical protein